MKEIVVDRLSRFDNLTRGASRV